MSRDRPESIELADVDLESDGEIPLISQVRRRSVSIAEFYAQVLESEIQEQLITTFDSIRRSPDKPRTALHALILKDAQTIGQIAALLHADPRTLKSEVGLLIEIGLAQVVGEGPRTRYSMLGSDESI